MKAHAREHSARGHNLAYLPYRQTGYEACTFCKSIHPRDLVRSLKCGRESMVLDKTPELPYPQKWHITGGLFGFVVFRLEHLRDATPEEHEIICAAIGVNFEFKPDGTIAWWPHV